MASATIKEADVVKEVRALFDSTPNGLIASQVESDYRNLCGKLLKDVVKRLGYTDTDSFLCSMARDGHVEVDYTGAGEKLYRAGVSDKSTEHLQKLVKRQVSNKSRSRGSRSSGRNRASHNNTPVKKQQLPLATCQNVIRLLRERNELTQLAVLCKLYYDKYGAQLNFRNAGFVSLRAAIETVEGINVVKEGDKIYISAKPAASVKSQSSHSDDHKSRLANEIAKVLNTCRDGKILLTDLSRKYSTVCNRPLLPSSYGYSNILSLVDDLVETLNITRVERLGDYVISLKTRSPESTGSSTATDTRSPEGANNYHHSKPIITKSNLQSVILDVVKSQQDGVYLSNFEQVFKEVTGVELNPKDYDYKHTSALLLQYKHDDLEIVNGLYGSLIRLKTTAAEPVAPVEVSFELQDAVGPGVGYNPPLEPPTSRYIEVIVSHVNSPDDFYLQVMANDNSGKRLEELMDLLEYAYNQHEAKKQYLLPPAFVKPGQVVVCRYPNDENWHRARITKVIDEHFVQVRFVDYGTLSAIHKGNLYFLRQKFLTLPIQAQQCELAGIKPKDGERWSVIAIRTFLSLTTDKRLCCFVLDRTRDQKLAVCLTDASGPLDIHINDYLVSSEFALFDDEKVVLPNNPNESDKFNWSVSSDEESDTELSAPVTVAAASSLNEAQRAADKPPPLILSDQVQQEDLKSPEPPSVHTDIPPLITSPTQLSSSDKVPASNVPSYPQRKAQTAAVKPQQTKTEMHNHPHRHENTNLIGYNYHNNPAVIPSQHQMAASNIPYAMRYNAQPMFMMNPHIENPMPYTYYPVALPARHPHPQYSSQPYPFQQPSLYAQQYRDPYYNSYQIPNQNPPLPQLTQRQAPATWQHGQTPVNLHSIPNNPPKLIPAPSSTIRPDTGPPPLIHQSQEITKQSVPAEPKIPQTQRTEGKGQQNQPVTLDQLTYKLTGLELKRKRLLREKSVAHNSADYSGAESSDSSNDDELSALDKEIQICRAEIAAKTHQGKEVKKIGPAGRGRGSLLLGLQRS